MHLPLTSISSIAQFFVLFRTSSKKRSKPFTKEEMDLLNGSTDGPPELDLLDFGDEFSSKENGDDEMLHALGSADGTNIRNNSNTNLADGPPNWLGNDGHEEETMKWLSDRDEMEVAPNGTIHKVSHPSTETTTQIALLIHTRKTPSSKKRYPYPCSCGPSCNIRYPPDASSQIYIPILSASEKAYRNHRIFHEKNLKEAISIITYQFPACSSTSLSSTPIDAAILDYANQILRLVKGKSRYDEEMFGNSRFAKGELKSAAEALLEELKWYYLLCWRDMKDEMDVEVDEAVLGIVRKVVDCYTEDSSAANDDVKEAEVIKGVEDNDSDDDNWW